jgi:Lipopolysaccharide kinase (Kdo/WaaP) family
MILRVPQGYTRFKLGAVDAVAHDSIVVALRETLTRGTLYEYAATHPERRALTGRAAVYAVPLPFGGPSVVVRHSRHGGLLARITRDLFLAPTRAPYELLVALLLARAGVATAPVMAYAIYPVIPLLRRADVATLEIAGADLGAVIAHAPNDSSPGWLAPVSDLLRGLASAGAWHPDLNIKNILLAPDTTTGATRAFVLDVDRIHFHGPEDPTVRLANFTRLEQSIRKWSARTATALDARLLIHLRELAFAT